MFSTEVVNSDIFLDMPPSSQALYFHLGMHCDDEGFVHPKKVMRMIGSGDDDLKILLGKKFVLPFDSGVFVQRHWKVNNYIRPDRKRPTSHREEIAQLSADNGGVYHLSTKRLPSGDISKEGSKEVEASKEAGNTDSNAAMQRARESLRLKKII